MYCSGSIGAWIKNVEPSLNGAEEEPEPLVVPNGLPNDDGHEVSNGDSASPQAQL